MTATIHWLVTSPRLPAGLMSAQAWDVLRTAAHVYAADSSATVSAVEAAGVEVTRLSAAEAVATLRRTGGVWIAGDDGDEHLARSLAEAIAAAPNGAEVELVAGSWDSPGGRLLDLVAVIDRLRSPGGCPWDAAQTHESLAPYLLEESYETVDAIQSGDRQDLREELGDVLMQPLLHARLASEDEDGFTIDDVAADIVAKLIRRHPHVFAGETAERIEDLHGRWDELKSQEKPQRRYATDGVVSGQPALSLAAKYLSRTTRAGLEVPMEADATQFSEYARTSDSFGELLMGLVALARRHDIEPELALREAAERFAARARAIEDSAS